MSLSTRLLGVGFFASLIVWGLWAGPTALSEPTSTTPEITRTLHTKPIAEIRLGERVLGRNPLREEVDDIPDIEPADWREVHLRLRKEDGRNLEIQLLRPASWLTVREAAIGKTTTISLPEMGAVGSARVTKIAPCPKLVEGKGNVVTGRFIHEANGQLLNLHVEGEPLPIGCTDNHPFWSEDRQRFVPAGELEVGELLKTSRGYARLERLQKRSGVSRVYNLEVYREHVYQVGSTGTLVHNAYPNSGSSAASTGGEGTARVYVMKNGTHVAVELIDGSGNGRVSQLLVRSTADYKKAVANSNKYKTSVAEELHKMGAATNVGGRGSDFDNLVDEIIEVPLADFSKAWELQSAALKAGKAGKFIHGKNSCVTHVEDILNAGGAKGMDGNTVSVLIRRMVSNGDKKFIEELRKLLGQVNE